MRKALIGILITATALTPLASAAAERPDRGDRQQARYEQRAERQQGRAERQQVRVERPQLQTQRQQVRVARPEVQAQRQRFDNPQRSFTRAERSRPAYATSTPAQFRGQRRSDRQDYRAQRPTRQQVAVNNIVARQPRQWNGSRSGSNWDRNRTSDWNRSDNWNRDRSSSWDRNRSGDSRSYNWNRNWRNDSRYDWQRYRAANRYRYHLPHYYSPYRGYGYSRFSIGFFLEPLFYSSQYWIADPWYYRLPPAYPGTQWVRYYDDALLVDMYSGEVIDVINDFFW